MKTAKKLLIGMFYGGGAVILLYGFVMLIQSGWPLQ